MLSSFGIHKAAYYNAIYLLLFGKKNGKVLKLYMNISLYLEISASLFYALPSIKHDTFEMKLVSAVLIRGNTVYRNLSNLYNIKL